MRILQQKVHISAPMSLLWEYQSKRCIDLHPCHCNGFEITSTSNTWLTKIYYLQTIWQLLWDFPVAELDVLDQHQLQTISTYLVGCGPFGPTQASLIQFSAHDKEQHRTGLTSLQIQDSNNADVLLDSGFNLFDIIINLCSKLHYEVLLK